MKKIASAIFILFIGMTPSLTQAFEFKEISNGTIITAGSTITVTIDPGDIPILFGVLFTISRGIVKAKLDSLSPFNWAIEIPKDFYGPLILRATGRRYYPIPNPPQTSVTLFVVLPAITISKPSHNNDTAIKRTSLLLPDRKYPEFLLPAQRVVSPLNPSP